MDRKTFKALSLALAIGTTAVAATVSSADEGRFYVAPGIQWMNFDSDRQSHDKTGYNFGFGYGLSDNLSTELSYSRISMNTLAGRDRLLAMRLDLLYKFDNSIGTLSPYFVGGLGDVDLQSGKDTTLNLGAGFSYRLNDIAEWRTAARTFYGIADRTFDLGIETGFVFHLGASAPAERVEPSAAPAPSEAAVIADADGDGVQDSRDACPDTPRNYAVDERGCPIMLDEVARIDLTVQFDFDQSIVKPEFFEDIRRVADFLAANDDVVAVVEGHTDSAGSDEYNQGLSERRAAAVRQVLIERFGVSAARVSSEGFGESRPVTSNTSAEGRAQNRRVVGAMTATMQRPQLRN
jgi:OOP family OmpA-OmpF porin